jgi:hypothetical protein
MPSYAERLEATKEYFPFGLWALREEDLDRYTVENCATAEVFFNRLLLRLAAMGETAPEPAKLGAFREAVEALNEFNRSLDHGLIETGEAAEVVELCNVVARVAGLDPARYGGGEGPASLWRDW